MFKVVEMVIHPTTQGVELSVRDNRSVELVVKVGVDQIGFNRVQSISIGAFLFGLVRDVASGVRMGRASFSATYASVAILVRAMTRVAHIYGSSLCVDLANGQTVTEPGRYDAEHRGLSGISQVKSLRPNHLSDDGQKAHNCDQWADNGAEVRNPPRRCPNDVPVEVQDLGGHIVGHAFDVVPENFGLGRGQGAHGGFGGIGCGRKEFLFDEVEGGRENETAEGSD
jgi:hypothetical protein